MKQINIRQITNLHNDVLRGLDFYDQELVILQERLEEIAADNTSDDVLKEVDHFQNQFIIHRHFISELRSKIHSNLRDIENQVNKAAGFVDVDTFTENKNLYEQYVDEEKIFNELRHEFNRFAVKWM